MPRTSALSRQYSYEPEILYDYQWATYMQKPAAGIASALNLSSTQEIDALWYNNAETRRIIIIWSDFVIRSRFMDGMTAPVPPKNGVRGVACKIFPLIFATWCTTQLMRVVPTLFSGSNLDTTPPELDAFDLFYALSILCPMKWHHEPSTIRLNIPSPVSSNTIEDPATALTSIAALEPEHALPVASGGDNIGSPQEGAISDYIRTREVLYQFAGKICEQFQQVQLSVESDEAEEDGNGSTLFAGMDVLVEQYTKTIGRRSIGNIIANNQPLSQLNSYRAQMGTQSVGETGRVKEIGPGGDIGPGVKHSGKCSQAPPNTQLSRRDNGVSKNKTRPSRVHNTGSNERIQAAFNSQLADTLNSPD
ncbi:hypothetical protein N7447_000196 [Penicillium robsamsonii]|uniref:uncharacterized protein n=1 Tax=Penicillium robsamsonii TaxID=1792511 RepID=UPI0025491822|nr:uncharacterized protein N7447_000196 [Penicillium robsamsonii]KAJ5834170.1 hypothetical protein N7447_000196 [Penicillium robsamsonii]